MPAPWIRRPFTLVVFFALALFAWTLGPLLVVICACVDSAQRRTDWAKARAVMYFIAFATCESLGLFAALIAWILYILTVFQAKDWYQRTNYTIQRFWGRGLYWSGIKIFNMEVVLLSPEVFSAPGPKLILMRHTSSLDTLIPIAFCKDGTGLRYVMKAELQWDPCLDFVGNRLPNCFVRRGTGKKGQEVDRVVELGKNLETEDALVIFPEGTRFTRDKHQQLAERAQSSDDPWFREATERLFHTLPPLRQGAIELVRNAEVDSVVIIAHRGAEAGSLHEVFEGGLIDRQFVIEAWSIPTSEIDKSDDGIKEFLLEQWTRVDMVAGG